MPEANQVKWIGVRGINPPEAVLVSPFVNAYIKKVTGTVSVAAAGSVTDSAILTPPTGYDWIILRLEITKDTDVTVTSVKIDGNEIMSSDGDTSSVIGYPLWGPCGDSVTVSGSNASTAAAENIYATAWVLEVPESQYMVRE